MNGEGFLRNSILKKSNTWIAALKVLILFGISEHTTGL